MSSDEDEEFTGSTTKRKREQGDEGPVKHVPFKKRLQQKEASTPVVNDPDEDEPEMDEDGYYGDEDKNRLLALPEAQRERILYDRNEKRKEGVERRRLQQQMQPAAPVSAEKRVATRSRGRQAAPPQRGGRSSALSDLKARRQRSAKEKRGEAFKDDEDGEAEFTPYDSDEDSDVKPINPPEEDDDYEDFDQDEAGEAEGEEEEEEALEKIEEDDEIIGEEEEEEELEEEDEEGRPKKKRRVPPKKAARKPRAAQSGEAGASKQAHLPHKKQQQLRNATKTKTEADQQEPQQPSRPVIQQKQPPPQQSQQPTQKLTLEQLKPVILKRNEVENWYGEPYFEASIRGLFVRVVLGNRGGGTATRRYALAEVTGVVPCNGYVLNGTKKQCNHYLALSIGTRSRNFQINYLSSGDIDDKEFQFWYRYLEKNKLPFPTMEQIEALKERRRGAETYVYTKQDYEESIQRQREKNPNPINFAKEKLRLLELVEKERAEGSEQRMKDYQKQLADVEEREKTQQQSEAQKKINLEGINRKNHEMNNQQRNLARQIMNTSNSKKEADEKEDLDPFARRKISTTFNWLPTNRKRQREEEGNDGNSSKSNNVLDDLEGGESDGEPSEKKIKLDSSSSSSSSSSFSSINVDISSINKTPTKASASSSSSSSASVPLPSGSLSLKDYLRRKASQ